eukprot:GFKZ01009255.1.p1 GENE.GFKZ01009255.1~~GFKZ01009255.1.p1  ORF type:complete len:551 (-),score=77.53 GFKZ01009255.1:1668-3320(-)
MHRRTTEDERRRLLDKLKSEFFLPPLREHKYHLEQVIGEGSYGVVCSAVDTVTQERVAVKRIMRVFEEPAEATRTLRELKFLRLLKDHENIISIKDVLLPSDRDRFDDVFVVLELMPTDLTRVLRSKIELTGEHIRWLVFQLIRGIYYIHTSRVFHRDLKPSNILINAQCDLRIVDFGLSRAAFDSQEPDLVLWTDYVATRWYRAPELIMAGTANYTTAIDMWSVGCIFAEMLNDGRALFPGHNPEDQLQQIVNVCGSPSPDAIAAVRDARARAHLQRMPRRSRRSMRDLFPHADPQAVDLLTHILEFDPAKRYTAEQALNHPYLKMDTVTPGKPIDMREFEFEKRNMSIPELRRLFLEEILKYHPDRWDEYMNPSDQPVLMYAPSAQATRFREAMNANQYGIEQPRAWESMPNQRFTRFCREATGMHSQAGLVQQVNTNGTVSTSTEGVDSHTTGVGPNGANVVVRTTGLPPNGGGMDVDGGAMGVNEEAQLMRYGKKFSSVESASSAFRPDSGQLGAEVADRRVSETLDSVMDMGQDIVTDVNDKVGT